MGELRDTVCRMLASTSSERIRTEYDFRRIAATQRLLPLGMKFCEVLRAMVTGISTRDQKGLMAQSACTIRLHGWGDVLLNAVPDGERRTSNQRTDVQSSMASTVQ